MENHLLSKIINKKISNISRACDLVSIQFDGDGHSDIILNIQCFFRFLKNNKIIISSEDMFKCDDDQEDFEWDIPGKSIYDKSVNHNKEILFDLKVIDVQKNNVGDLEIKFTDNVLLQIFINTVEAEEKYRIFDNECELIVNN